MATDYLMEESKPSVRQLAVSSKRFARQLLAIGGNRLELLTVEVQEEREHLLHGRELIIPYAMSDSATSFITVPLDEVLAALE